MIGRIDISETFRKHFLNKFNEKKSTGFLIFRCSFCDIMGDCELFKYFVMQTPPQDSWCTRSEASPGALQ